MHVNKQPLGAADTASRSNRRIYHLDEFDAACESILRSAANIQARRNKAAIEARLTAKQRANEFLCDLIAFVSMAIFCAGMIALACGIAAH